MSKKTWLVAVATTITILVAGYAMLRIAVSVQLIDRDFEGLSSIVNRGDNRTLHLLMIHGIGRHCIGYGQSFADQLAERLDLVPLGNGKSPEIDKSLTACKEKQIFNSEYEFSNNQFENCHGLNGGSHESCQRMTIDVAIESQSGQSDTSQFDTGYIRTQDYAVEGSDHVRMRFYETTWDPATRTSKIRYVQKVDYQFEERRVPVNHALKRDLINDTVTDAVLYLGNYKRVMQYPLLVSFCKIVESGLDVEQDTDSMFECDFEKLSDADFASFGETNDISIITHSLGTRMLFDTLGLMTDPQLLKTINESLKLLGATFDYRSEDEAISIGLRTAFSSSLRHIFTMANQVPIFQLSRIRNPLIPIDDADLGEGFSNFLDERAKSTEQPLEVVAFTDPNDLLSYNLKCAYYMNVLKQDPGIKRWRKEDQLSVRHWFERCNKKGNEVVWEKSDRHVSITDVTLNLAEPIPYFVANPTGAHSNYFTDERVLDMIACGAQAATNAAQDCEMADAVAQAAEIPETGRAASRQ